MKALNLLTTAVLTLSTALAGAKDIKIDKNTKQVTPTKYIHKFELIDWDQLEERQNNGKVDDLDFHVMMCDDNYSSLVEIEFSGIVGKDVQVQTEGEGCELEGVSNSGWGETTLQFHGPDYQCTITIEKKQNGKKIRKHYELHDAC